MSQCARCTRIGRRKGICCKYAGSERLTPKTVEEEFIAWTEGVHAPVALTLTMRPNRRKRRDQGATAEIVAAADVNDGEAAAWPLLKGTVVRRFAIPATQPLEVNLFRKRGQEYCAVCLCFKWRCVHNDATEGTKAKASGGSWGVGGDQSGGI